MSETQVVQLDQAEFTDAQINQSLRQLPAFISKKAHEVMEAEAKVKQTKHILTLQEASTKIAAKEEAMEDGGKEPSATYLNAKAYQNCAETREMLLDDEKALELAKIHLQYYRDLFDSVRKAANLKIEEMKSLSGTVSNRQYTG